LKPGTILTSSAGTGQVIRIPATQNVVGTAGNIAQLQVPGGRQVNFLLFGKNTDVFVAINGVYIINSVHASILEPFVH
jgi:hypothetical protein